MNELIVSKRKFPYMISVTQWFITTILQIDRFFFTYETETGKYILIKFLYLLVLCFFWKFVFHVYERIKAGDPLYIRAFRVFCFYFVIVMIMLLILWPGTWSWDDALDLVDTERYYRWNPWQHILTAIYHEILLQILPFPGGIILLQNTMIAATVGFFVAKAESAFEFFRLKNVHLDIIVKIIPFLLPPVLMYQFSGYRMGPYIYLELLVLFMWLCMAKERKACNWPYLLVFCIGSAVVATWRSESLLYIPFICAWILFAPKSIWDLKRKMVGFLLILLVYGSINQVQNIMLENNSYKLISILRPCAELVRAADQEEDKELLEDVGRAVNLFTIYDNPEADGEVLYWQKGAVKPEHTDEDYKVCLRAFVKLCIKYPEIVVKERMKLFAESLGLTGTSRINTNHAKSLFDEGSWNEAADRVLSSGWIAIRPVFRQLRKYFIDLLDNPFTKRIVWNTAIPLLVLIYAWIKSLIKKKWNLWWILSAVIVKVPVVMLTQPSCWFMYFLSFYFLGYITLVYSILHYLRIRGNETIG